MRFVFISQMHAQQNAPDRPVSGAFLYWPCGWQRICGRTGSMDVNRSACPSAADWSLHAVEALVEMHMMHIVDADQFQMPGSVRQGPPLDSLKKLLSKALVLPIRQDHNFLQVIGRDVIVFLEVPDGKAYSRW